MEQNSSYKIVVSQKVENLYQAGGEKKIKLIKIVPGLTNLDMGVTRKLKDSAALDGFTATAELIVTGKYRIEQFTKSQES